MLLCYIIYKKKLYYRAKAVYFLEAVMKKGKAITLLSLISLILVAAIVATFASFSVGIKDYNSILGAVNLDYDMTGGASYTYTLSRENKNNVEDIDEVVDVISSRLDSLGYHNYDIETIKDVEKGVEDYDIKVTSGSSQNLEEDMKAVFAYGTVEMYLGTSANPTTRVLEDKEIISSADYLGETKYNDTISYPVEIKFSDDAYDLIMASLGVGDCYVELKLGEEVLLSGSSKLSEDYFSGKTLPITAPSEAIAKREVLQLSTGGLDYQYEIKSAETIDAVFGDNTALYSVITVSAVALIVIIAFAIMFKGFGLVSAYSLLAFLLGEVGLLVGIPNIKLSMAGVAGIIVATILATDGLILTFNRIKEEFSSGKTVKAAVNAGYRRAFRPILNAHVVSLIVSLLLFALLGNAVRGFAITLSIGTIISFIATALISRLMTIVFIPLIKKPEVFFNFKREEN